ncbi:MAG: bacteriophage holin [Candidatus Omnitrophica bacterium]|nr:bacteriophage holin [Candidatus Omnitrophota bacterium]
MKLDVKAFGLAAGVIWALGVFLAGVLSALTGWGMGFVGLLCGFYLGYSPTILGSAIGAVWAFVDGLAGGLLFAWLYNKLVK